MLLTKFVTYLNEQILLGALLISIFSHGNTFGVKKKLKLTMLTFS